jgi:L-fucose isomerase-like protein
VEVRVKPIYNLGAAWHVFPQPDCQLEVATTPQAIQSCIEGLHRDLQERLRVAATFLEPAAVRHEGDLRALLDACSDVDAFLVNVTTGGLANDFLTCEIPIIAYSGEYAPMMALYNLPYTERAKYPHITYALDAAEVDEQLQLLGIRKRLRQSKVIILGEYVCADRLPVPEQVADKLGVHFMRISGAEFVEMLPGIDPDRVEAVAAAWEEDGLPGAEPSGEEIRNTARCFVALESLLDEHGAQAASIGCLELMYAQGQAPFCLALAQLRDEGLPAGCEADMSATLTMLVFEYLTDQPAYMGNLVRAEPDTNRLHISHGCSPRRIAGRNRPEKPFRLVHSHSAPPFSRDLRDGSGVTSYVDYGDRGQEVTIARMAADLDVITAARGEIVECRDTICDRTTLTLAVRDAREYVHKATGNHQVVVYGDHLEKLRKLCLLLGIQLIQP